MTTVETPPVTEQSSSRFVQTKSWKLHYNEAGTGHPLVMLHGSGPGATGWANFRANIEPLSAKYRVLAFDMPGWGQSDTLTDPAQHNHADALLEAMDELELEKVSIIGNSMGGMTGLIFATRYPDRLSHLIGMGTPSPGVNILSPGGPSEGIGSIIETYLDPSPANFKRLVRLMAYDSSFATDELAELRSRAAQARPEHLKHFVPSMSTLIARFDEIAPMLAAIPTPTLIVHGRDDRTVNLEHGLRLVAQIPNSRLLVLNHCGHWAQIEHAAEFNRLVDDFVTHN